jgi:hypothetical protein
MGVCDMIYDLGQLPLTGRRKDLRRRRELVVAAIVVITVFALLFLNGDGFVGRIVGQR